MASKILIVDDEPDLLRLIAYEMQVVGYEVVTAATGSEALRKIPLEQPDLVILDLMLPDIGGVEVCKQLRNNVETADLPIVILSARAQVADKVRSLQAGADEYISKPVDSEELVARVRAILKFTSRMKQLQPSRQGKIIGCLGAKGGVGTTTLVLNVAALLAQQKKEVIAAEIRPSYGTFSLATRYRVTRNLSDLVKLEVGQINNREVNDCLCTLPCGPKLLFGPQSPEEFREIDAAKADAVVRELSSLADLTLVDLPPLASEANQAILRRSNAVVLVVEPEPASLAAAKTAIETLRAWNIISRLTGVVVVNRVALCTPLSLADIRSQLECEIVGTVPPAADILMTAHSRGVPLAVFRPDHLAVGNLVDISNRVTGAVEPVRR